MKTLIAKMLQACVLLVLLAGCAVGPDYVRPETDTAETWSESIDASLSTDPVEYGPWWSVIEDPALERLVQIASKDNLPLQIAAARILEARAVLGISRGLRFPQQQQLAGTAARVSLSENAPNVAIADRAFSFYAVGFDAAWRSVELALVQYRQGSVTYQRVLDTQRFLVRQEDQLAGTKDDVALNLVATYKALGGGWDTEQAEGAQQ